MNSTVHTYIITQGTCVASSLTSDLHVSGPTVEPCSEVEATSSYRVVRDSICLWPSCRCPLLSGEHTKASSPVLTDVLPSFLSSFAPTIISTDWPALLDPAPVRESVHSRGTTLSYGLMSSLSP